ncbi:MAG TPA: hypothetical protein VD978_32040 [Azospirillum sp.]|nr:hypothetical protein [Azospirillum sp.]
MAFPPSGMWTQIAKDYRDGALATDLARKFGCSVQEIQEIVSIEGARRQRPVLPDLSHLMSERHPPMPPIFQWPAIVSDVVAGMPPDAVAAKHGIAVSTLAAVVETQRWSDRLAEADERKRAIEKLEKRRHASGGRPAISLAYRKPETAD